MTCRALNSVVPLCAEGVGPTPPPGLITLVSFFADVGLAGVSIATTPVAVQVDEDLFICVGWDDDPVSITGVTDDVGNVYAPVTVKAQDPGPVLNCQIWHARSLGTNPANVITITFSGAGTTFAVVVPYVLSGVNAVTAVEDAVIGGGNTAAPTTGNLTSSAGSALLSMGYNFSGASTFTWTVPAVKDVDTGANASTAHELAVAGGAHALAATFTGGASPWAAAMISILPVP